jgi:hypothetical protein
MLRGLLREPLVHFLVVGGLLFALFGRNASELASQGKEIVVTAADLERLAGMFNRTWHRPPSEDELRAAVEDFVREEVLYRSAVSLGLDKDDTVIRRRLRQKMDFMSEDTVPLPRDAELHAFFDAHEDQFRVEALVSFRQIFFDTTRHQDAAGDASRLLQRLQSDEAKVDNEGDPFLLAEVYNATPIGRIAALLATSSPISCQRSSKDDGWGRSSQPLGSTLCKSPR